MTRKTISSLSTLLLFLLAANTAQAQLGTTFTLQGRLSSSGPGNPGRAGQADLSFSLYDAATGGQQVGSTQFVDDVEISGGRYAVELDFGPVFDGSPFWIEVARRQGRGQNAGYSVVGPRIPVLAVPYAQYAIAAGWAAEADHALEADHASTSDHAIEADHSARADDALRADEASEAEHAAEADHAARADRATEADRALEAQHARTADTAGNADFLDLLDSSAFLRTTGGTVSGDLEVNGEVRATRFIGDGSGLTNLPTSSAVRPCGAGYASVSSELCAESRSRDTRFGSIGLIDAVEICTAQDAHLCSTVELLAACRSHIFTDRFLGPEIVQATLDPPESQVVNTADCTVQRLSRHDDLRLSPFRCCRHR